MEPVCRITCQGFDLESPNSLKLCINCVYWDPLSKKRSFKSNVYIDISQEQVDLLTSGEDYFDRWVTEKDLHV